MVASHGYAAFVLVSHARPSHCYGDTSYGGQATRLLLQHPGWKVCIPTFDSHACIDLR